ncbi:MAG: hypothetical protein JWQ94_611, partial [Tardiphaga sp.]|nr:hypothetical protein [Tardiphaga sp.]
MRLLSLTTIRSIQLKIALVAGLCLVATSAVLIGYSLVSTQTTHHYVASEVMHLVDTQTKESLMNRAGTEASAIKAQLEAGIDAARAMAQTFAVLADPTNGTPVADRRTQLAAVLLNVLKQNPAFSGTYSAWEPDSLDGNDAAFKGRKELGSDNTGRFLPYWTRSESGAVAIQPLVEYDSTALNPNGLVKGAW